MELVDEFRFESDQVGPFEDWRGATNKLSLNIYSFLAYRSYDFEEG